MKFYANHEGLVAQAENAQDNIYMETLFGLSGAVESIPVVIHSNGRRTAGKPLKVGSSPAENYILRIELASSFLSPVTADALSKRIFVEPTAKTQAQQDAEFLKTVRVCSHGDHQHLNAIADSLEST